MNKKRLRFAPALSAADAILEDRIVQSGAGLHVRAAEVATRPVRKSATETTLAVNSGTLGQPITFTVTVRAPAAAGSPQGTVELLDHGQDIQELTLTPMTSTNPRFAYSQATYTITPQPGGVEDFFGRYTVNAKFIPAAGFATSTAKKSFNVNEPEFTKLADGVETATVEPGSGPQIESGQTAGVVYTGYLASSGSIFDDSVNHGGAPMTFTVGAGQVITGFDEGTAGMQVGETRLIVIPPAEGYGSTGNGSIPANSTLVFVVTLESIS